MNAVFDVGIMQGIVLSFSNQHAKVKCEDGLTRLCTIKGKRIRALDGWYNALAAGDRVSVQSISDTTGLIESLLPRKRFGPLQRERVRRSGFGGEHRYGGLCDEHKDTAFQTTLY